MKPSAPTPQHQSEPDSSIPMPVWSDIDCDDIPDIEAKNSGTHLPGVRPADELRVMDRASALREVPNLKKFQQRLAEVCARDDYSPEHAALLFDHEGVALDLTLDGRAMLIVNIPTYLAPLFAQLVGSRPEIVNWPTLDLKDSKTLMLWSVTDKHGRTHSIALPAGLLVSLPNSYNVDDEFSWMEFIFCCADQVAFSRVWIDESFTAEAQAGGMSGLQYWHYSDTEQVAANAAVAAAGSPTPWYGNPWVNDDGTVLTEIGVWENSYLIRLDGEESEDYVDVPVPPSEVRVVSRATASEFLPELERYQSRLAAACAAKGSNPETAAHLVEWAESGDNAPYGPGPILFANLPAHFAPILSKFADCSINLHDWPSLDLNGGSTLAMWSVRDDDSCVHTVAIDAGLLPLLATPFEYSTPYVRVAFCCGDSVVYGRYLIYNEHMSHAYSTGVSELCYYSDDELNAANIKVAKAGSSAPWYAKPWNNRAEGSTLTQLAVWKDSDSDSRTDELKNTALEEYVPPMKPTVELQVVEQARAAEILPDFDGQKSKLDDACVKSGVNPQAAALFVCKAGQVGAEAPRKEEPLLIANLPSYLLPLLEKLASKAPKVINKPTLDLRECATLLSWSVRDEKGQLHIVAIDVGVLGMLGSMQSDGTKKPRVFRTAFCCADKVALSELWIDEADLREVETTLDGTTQYGNFDDEEQEAGAARTAAAGSTEPWLGHPWKDDDGSTFTQLVLFIQESSDGQVLKYR